jgi:class 3 adenylate cyclase
MYRARRPAATDAGLPDAGLPRAPRPFYTPRALDEPTMPAPAGDDRISFAERRVQVSLRLKITLTFLLVGILLSGTLSFTVYRILDDGLLRQVQARVLDMTELGAGLVDAAALGRLAAGVSGTLTTAQVDQAEASPDYRTVSDALNRVRVVEKQLVHYIYIFVPTRDPATALFLVDGDVLDLRAQRAAGRQVAETDISHFGSVFDITDLPVARRALAQQHAFVEDTWSYDPDFHVRSITGYAPVLGPGGAFVGVMGIDMVDTDVRLILSSATTIALVVILGALALTLAASVLLGTFFSRGIITLDQVVRRFASNNLEVRVQVRSRDEVGRLGVSFNAMADTVQQYSERLEALLTAYGRFVPHELLRILDKKSILDLKLGDQVQREMTVLFSDIVSFTSLSETMSPYENFNFLNSYLRRMGPEIRACNGFIDKYIGDGIMALFPGRADDALAAAVRMRERLFEYNMHRRKSGYRPISSGIGVQAGSVMMGTLGEHERMDGSVISDTVNLASRLQGLTRIYGSAVLTTGRTLKALEDPAQFRCRFVDRVQVKGRRETILLFEVVDGELPEQRDRRLGYRAEFASALRLYFARDFQGAATVIRKLYVENPGDKVLRIYRDRCDTLIRNGTPADWTGVQVY